jgi:tetratricopeptide (TPR) repeat protein
MDRPTDRALAMATWLAEVEVLMARAAWGDARRALEVDLDAVATNAELTALYGEALLRMGEARDAIGWLEPRLTLLAATPNRRAFTRIVNLAGAAAFELGRIDDAALFFEVARERAVSAGDHLTAARALNNLALVASTRAQWRTAMQYYMLAIPSYERVGEMRGIAECHHNVAATLIEAGDFEEAEEWHRRAMQLAIELGNDRLRAFILGGRAEVRLRTRDHDMAIVLGRQAARVFRTLGDRSSEAHALGIVGQAEQGMAALGQLHEQPVIDTLRDAIEMARESGVLRVLADLLMARARSSMARTDGEAARYDLLEARQAYVTLGSTDKIKMVDTLLADPMLRSDPRAG